MLRQSQTTGRRRRRGRGWVVDIWGWDGLHFLHRRRSTSRHRLRSHLERTGCVKSTFIRCRYLVHFERQGVLDNHVLSVV